MFSINPLFSQTIPNSIFIERSQEARVSQVSTPYSLSDTVDKILRALSMGVPLAAYGNFGPTHYAEDPIPLNIDGREIYGWRPGASRKESEPEHVIIVGAKKGAREHVYYTMAERTSPITYRASSEDTKIYVMSHKTFAEQVLSYHEPVALRPHVVIMPSLSQSRGSPASVLRGLSEEEKKFGNKLCTIPLNEILDRGRGESSVKALGQAIFDHFKGAAGGDSMAGKVAMQKICDALRILDPEQGHLRTEYVERAWNWVGDDNWRWHA